MARANSMDTNGIRGTDAEAHPYGVAMDSVTIKDTSNGNRACTFGNSTGTGQIQYLWAFEAPATNSTYGILVGTGTMAPANTDYTIQTQTAHGTSANQLQYQATSVGAAAVVGSNVDRVVMRIFVNGSGGTITLKEIGIVWYGYGDGVTLLY